MNTQQTLAAIGLALSLLTPALPVKAADEQVPKATEVFYTTVAGDTLEKLAGKLYPGSPLQTTWLVRHLLEANTVALGKASARQKLKAGTRLHVPEHARLVQQALTPFLPAPQETAQAAYGPEARRRWVHYP